MTGEATLFSFPFLKMKDAICTEYVIVYTYLYGLVSLVS